MKNVTLQQFVGLVQDEYRARFGGAKGIQDVSFLRELRTDQKETSELIMAVAKKLKVPVSKGRIHDEFLHKGTYYNVRDLFEEFERVAELVMDRNYRVKWWSIGGAMIALSLYCITQAWPVHAIVLVIMGGGIFERLKGMPRVY